MDRFVKRRRRDAGVGAQLQGANTWNNTHAEIWRVLARYLEWPEVLALTSSCGTLFRLLGAARKSARDKLCQHLHRYYFYCHAGLTGYAPCDALPCNDSCFHGFVDVDPGDIQFCQVDGLRAHQFTKEGLLCGTLGKKMRTLWQVFGAVRAERDPRISREQQRYWTVVRTFSPAMARIWRISGYLKCRRPSKWD